MNRIPLEINLLPGLAESLVDPLTILLQQLTGSLPRQLQQPEETDLADIWNEELQQGFQADSLQLIRMLGDPDFGNPGYSLSVAEVESAIRGCSGMRLALREHVLPSISDSELERGLLHPHELTPDLQEPFGCYWFLGALQEFLITALDPDNQVFGDNI